MPKNFWRAQVGHLLSFGRMCFEASDRIQVCSCNVQVIHIRVQNDDLDVVLMKVDVGVGNCFFKAPRVEVRVDVTILSSGLCLRLYKERCSLHTLSQVE